MRRDEDNVMSAAKFILDALQDMDIILNDSRKYVHLTQEVFTDRDNPRIEITIKGDELCQKETRKQRYSTVLLTSLV